MESIDVNSSPPEQEARNGTNFPTENKANASLNLFLHCHHLCPLSPPACETQGMLDKAQELNTSAREVFEYIARCKKCGTSSGVGSAGGGARTSSASGIKRGDAGKIVDTSSAARPEGPNGTTLRPGTALTKVNISCAYT